MAPDNWRDCLEDSRALMKTGLGLVLVGHVNFLLAALLHGAVLRHVSLHEKARASEYAVANVLVIIAGLLVSPGGRGQWNVRVLPLQQSVYCQL